MNKRVELLAPAGNKEAFIGSINAGADAIYLAGKQFGARKFAHNFTDQELLELIKYAHLRDVRVFVTINTLIYESEVADVLTYADFLVSNHVDALIVQDIGLIETFVKRYPDTEIHASTQLNTYSIHQLQYLKSIGVSRVILARETPLEDIHQMVKEVDMDLEIFIHGALCVSASGNCYFSYMNGGRSGNRGECAQPCRLPYQLYRNEEQRNEESYLLSTKDLMTLPKLDDLLDSGVVSLKIEGRMRREEYVVSAVRAYREAIDAYINKQSFNLNKRIQDLEIMFNRSFTRGYLFEQSPKEINYNVRPNHQGVRIGEVVDYHKGKASIKLTDSLYVGDGYRILGTSDIGGKVDRILDHYNLVSEAHQGMTIQLDLMRPVEIGSEVRKTMDYRLDQEMQAYIDHTYKLIPLSIEIVAHVGQHLSVKLKTPFVEPIVQTSDYVVEKAKKQGQSKEQILEQFVKFGDTFYDVTDVIVRTKEDGFIPNKLLKDLRRQSLAMLEETILDRKEKRIIHEELSISKQAFDTQGLSVKVENDEQYEAVKGLGIERIYCMKNLSSYSDNRDTLFLNRIEKDKVRAKKMVVHDMGQFHKKSDIITSPYVNVTNHLSLARLLKKGVKRVTLSPELTVDQMIELIEGFKKVYHFTPTVEVLVYGRLDLMVSAYCPIQKGERVEDQGCMLCEKYQYTLKNKEDKYFPIIRDTDCVVRNVDQKPINLLHDVKRLKLAGIKHFASYFTHESPSEIKRILEKTKQCID